MAPRPLAPRVFVFDSGEAPPAGLPPDAIALPCLASEAFGDGSHPTTRLCAGALDFLLRTEKPRAVLDVGTGTGILARIARARGAAFVAATDIDPVALASAHENAQLDQDLGRVSKIEIGAFSPDHWGARFDLVIANILEGPLRELAPLLSKALLPGGTLLISGFTRLQAPALAQSFQTKSLNYLGDATLEEWVVSTFKKA